MTDLLHDPERAAHRNVDAAEVCVRAGGRSSGVEQLDRVDAGEKPGGP